MKILTTQNLNSLVNKENTTNNSFIPGEIRYNFLQNKDLMNSAYAKHDEISFKAKPSSVEIEKMLKAMKKALKSAKKGVGEVTAKATPEAKRGDKFRQSPLFKWALGVADYETVVQSTIAAVACALRALTIVGMSNEENKGNNTYAAGHALASGIVGFITVFALTTPFKAGADHVLKKMFKDLDLKTLKRLHPQLAETSIADASGKRLDPELWKDLNGNIFSTEIKNCDMLPKFKQLYELSNETFEKILKITNVDWAAQKGKSFNEVVTKDGKRLYDIIDFNSLGLTIEHTQKCAKNGKDVVTNGQILFRDMDKEYLKDFISKLDDTSNWKNLDVESAFDGKVMRDFRSWKDKAGNNWMLDLDTISVASPFESIDRSPRITGRMRFDEKEGIFKFLNSQRNGKEVEGSWISERGTEITEEMLIADKESAGLIRNLTWLPDLIFRVPIAMTTIAMIPWILKTVFGIEKQKPQVQPKAEEVKDVNVEATTPEIKSEKITFKGHNSVTTSELDDNKGNVSFKAAAPKKVGFFTKIKDIIGEWMAKLYAKRLIENEFMAKVSARLADIPGGLTQAMATLGALLTSATYVTRTLKNKDLEDDKKRTLAVNQTLCWIVPTIASYSVDKLIGGWVKQNEYRFSGQEQRVADILKIEGKSEEAKAVLEKLSKNVKGVRILASLATFTLIYRYVTPVLITPFANKIGDKINAKRAEKKVAQAKVA